MYSKLLLTTLLLFTVSACDEPATTNEVEQVPTESAPRPEEVPGAVREK